LGQERGEVDDDVLGADGDARALGALDVEAHHRLVDRADLLDVEGAVGEALAVEDEQALEDAPEHAVGDAGGLEGARRVARRRRGRGPRGRGSCRGRRGWPWRAGRWRRSWVPPV
jgi:hypothetical protein